MNPIVRETTKVLLALILVFGGLFALTFAMNFFKSRSMREFCANVADADAPTTIIKRAEEMGYLVIDVMSQREVVVVLNHRAPMFRYSCEVSFKDGKVAGTNTRMAD